MLRQQIRCVTPAAMTLPHVLTQSEVADFLGVGTPAVATWAQDGALPVCAQSESGELLFYRWRVERDGPKLAAGERVNLVRRGKRRDPVMLHEGRRLACGCLLDGDPPRPVWLCPDARQAQSLVQFVETLAKAAPDEPVLARMARAVADVLANHLTPPNEPLPAQETARRDAPVSSTGAVSPQPARPKNARKNSSGKPGREAA